MTMRFIQVPERQEKETFEIDFAYISLQYSKLVWEEHPTSSILLSKGPYPSDENYTPLPGEDQDEEILGEIGNYLTMVYNMAQQAKDDITNADLSDVTKHNARLFMMTFGIQRQSIPDNNNPYWQQLESILYEIQLLDIARNTKVFWTTW